MVRPRDRRSNLGGLLLGAAAIACVAGTASAVPVLITAPTTIAPTDTTITPTGGGAAVPLAQAEITVRGTTLTVNGRHTIQSLTIERSGSAPGVAGVLTHGANTSFDYSGEVVFGASIIITGDLVIQGVDGANVASRIDLTGRGFPSGTGPGTDAPTNGNGQSAGGGHGGFGGRGFSEPVSALGGLGYGDAVSPTTFGSGGGPNNSNGVSLTGAGAGGGALKLDVGGTVTLNGLITANGTDGTASWWSSGGGAGGSVWIIASDLAGSGSIVANGGAGNVTYGAGGGGGGRIRLDIASDATSFTGSAVAFGGAGNTRGGAGTVTTNSPTGPVIVVQNDVATSAGTAIQSASPITSVDIRANATATIGDAPSYGNITIRSGGTLRIASSILASSIDAQSGSTILAAAPLVASTINCTTFNLATGAVWSVDGAGHPSSEGPGAGANSTTDGGGAGHGGIGGRGNTGGANNGLGGSAYGAFDQPATFGSGGGASSSSGVGTGGAGAGGGIIRLVANSAVLNGTISASGGNGTTPWYDSGGGSGGSIWITANTLSGNGIVRANGGDGARTYSTAGAGGGSGGRVAIVANGTSTFAGTIEAAGGRGTISGGAGTVYTRTGAGAPVLVARTVNANPALTPFPGTLGVDVVVGSGARVTFAPGTTMSKLNVLNGGRVVTSRLVPIDLRVTGDLTIEAGGVIDANGAGHPSSSGPAGGTPTFGAGAGGGHGGGGGAGGRQPSFATASFGAADNPFGFGSGGGSSSSSATENGGGGAGGGAVRLDVGGQLVLSGEIAANGLIGQGSWWDSGGGAGGGIQIIASSLSGSGTVSARGGNGARVYLDGGGGGGGRIGIFSCNTTLPLANIVVDGGLGGNGGGLSGQPGQPGSVFFGASSITITDQPDPVDITVGQGWTMSVSATTSQPDGQISYQWRRRNDSGVYVPIVEGFDNRYFNVNTSELLVTSGRCVQEALYDCIVTDACGSFPTRSVLARIVSPIPCPCPADFDNSGGIDAGDIVAFFEVWEAGLPEADLDASGGIDFGDVGSFFASYEGGC